MANSRPMADYRNEAFDEALDAWRAELAGGVVNPRQLTRDEAVLILAGEALVGMGLLQPADRPQ